jgi:hypothetical protein
LLKAVVFVDDEVVGVDGGEGVDVAEIAVEDDDEEMEGLEKIWGGRCIYIVWGGGAM